jgi:NAD+ synthase (glutamine-hydrolysing)
MTAWSLTAPVSSSTRKGSDRARQVVRRRSDLLRFETLTGDVHDQIEGRGSQRYAALVLGTRDYMRKCGFRKAIIGLSGGIDSRLTAVIAADAVGRENVVGVGMPGPYSSPGSSTMPRALARISASASSCSDWRHLRCLPANVAEVFAGRKEDVTEENIQSRAFAARC